jgi:hypothetical protein
VLLIAGCTATQPASPQSAAPAPTVTNTATPNTSPAATGVSASPSALPTSSASTAAVPTVVVRDLPPVKPPKAKEVVNDPSLIDYHPRAVADAEPQGPVTFSVSGDTVVIDNELPDQAVLVTYRNGRKVRTVRSPDDCCIDLRVEGDRYWTLGDYATEWVLKKGAHRLTEVKRTTLPPDTDYDFGEDPDANYVQWDGGFLERTDTGLFAVPSDGPTVLLEGTGTDPDGPPWHNEGKSLVIKDPGFTAKIRARAKHAEAGIMSRYGGYVYYQVTDNVGPNWGYIYQFTTIGTLVHTYTLHQGFIQTGNRIIVITDDAQVYQLVITTKTARVLHLPPN